ncbi:hypothetical protein QZH41_002014 [Actinostola sp. cb2023]|nr:hypothetical protein QZH41_002014 [Actinostola sp. cb2023]
MLTSDGGYSAWWYSLDEEHVGIGRRSRSRLGHNAVLRTTDEKEEKEEESKLKLKPKEVNFNKETSRAAHRTDEYVNKGLIVRRGQEFKITVTFNRPFDDKQDSVILQLSFGSSPKSSKGTLIRIEVTNQLSTSSWGMRIDNTSGNTVSLTVMSPANALVGEYSVFVDTKTKKRGSEGEYLKFRKKADEMIIILFNAWCKVLRALGIPTRSVTNFQSAHDHDASMTIDIHVDKDGERLNHLNDSVWNYHVWNESYFARPDLPPGYGGWQVHDATPQETSDGIFCCGPCPVKAIKWGDIHLPYDAGFVFGEVNGDRVYWEVDETTGDMEVIRIEECAVGKNISTKAVGSNAREDLTQYYKHMDGSLEERKVVRKVNEHSSIRSLDIYKPSAEDVEFKIILPVENLLFGDNFRVELYIKNTSDDKRNVKYSMSAKLMFYTGVVIERINGQHDDVELKGNEEKRLFLDVDGDVYFYKAGPDSSVEIDIKAKVMETRQTFFEIDAVAFMKKPEIRAQTFFEIDAVDFMKKPEIRAQTFFEIDAVDFMKKPEIRAQFPDKIVKNKSFDIELFFSNPFVKVDLTECKIIIESSRHVAPDTMIESLPPVPPNTEVSYIATFIAESKGKQASRQAGKQASRQAGKQASRQAGKQASRQAGKQASRQAGKQASRQAGKQASRQAGKQASRQAGKQASRQAGKQASRQAGKQASRQAGKQASRQAGKQASRQAGKQASRQAGKQASRQAGKQASRQAGKQASRQAGKQASRQAGKQASRQAGKQASRQAGKQASRQAGKQASSRQAGKQASRQAGKQASRQAGKQASRQAGKQASRQAGKQASRQAGKQASRQAGKQASRQGLTEYRISGLLNSTVSMSLNT